MACSWLCYHPPPRGSILLLTLACEVPWAQDPILVFPLFPLSPGPVPSPICSERMDGP